MKQYKLGIIGLGRWAEKYCQTLSLFPQIKLVAAMRRGKGRPDFLPEETVLYRHSPDLFAPKAAKMYSEHKLDGVIIATDRPFDFTCESLKMGIPTLAEKPLLLNNSEYIWLVSAALKGKLLVDYIHLFSPAYQRLKEIVGNKQITRIYSQGYNAGPTRDRFSPLFDYGPHCLSLILDLLNQYPTDIHITKQGKTKTGELFCINLYFGKVKTESLVGNGALIRARSLHVFYLEDGKQKEVIYDDTRSAKMKLLVDGVPVEYDISTSPLQNTVSTFLRLIDGEEDYREGAELTAKITRILSTYTDP